MNFPTTPSLRLIDTIKHNVDTALVEGFTARDVNHGLDCIVLKGGLLPGDGCVGIYNDIEDRIIDEDLTLYIISRKEVHGTGVDEVEAASPHTFDDVPLYKSATLSCIPLDDFETWDRDEVEIE